MTTTTNPTTANCERVIRSFAASVNNSVHARRVHPTYGHTKTAIRAELERMEGAIGLYMVLTGQSNHAMVPALAKFSEDSDTASIVSRARAAVASL